MTRAERETLKRVIDNVVRKRAPRGVAGRHKGDPAPGTTSSWMLQVSTRPPRTNVHRVPWMDADDE